MIKNISIPLNEMDKDANYFSVLDPEDKLFNKNPKIKNKPFKVRALFLDLERWPFRKITMPKSIF